MTKVNFFYCTGTSYTWSMLENGFREDLSGIRYVGDIVVNPVTAPTTAYVAGLNGKVAPFTGGVQNDPFPFLLDTAIWNPIRVAYAASSFNLFSPTTGTLIGGMGSSINDGVNKVMDQINDMPSGTPFALGGYSQGAAVMSTIYNELRTGSLTGRKSSFLGGVMFGNPRREINHRGEIGGTWSGAWDVPYSNIGGHGSFPASGPYGRLSGCDGTEWIEFTAPNDIISSTGDSPTGVKWTQGNDVLISLAASKYFGKLVSQVLASLVHPAFADGAMLTAITQAFSVGNTINYLVDAVDSIGKQPGAGHVLYPMLPPAASNGIIPTTSVLGADGINYLKADGQTCYQLALAWLESKAQSYARAPILLPSTGSVGWSTTLVAPAS
jgi:hypothetical protein